MNAPRHDAGYTLVELLVGLAIAAIILLPLADLLRSSADSAQLVRTRLDLHADAGFALDRIADKAARKVMSEAAIADERSATVDKETANWLTLLGLALCPSRELLEGANCAASPRTGILAAQVARIEVTSPVTDGAISTLRIALTLTPAGNDAGLAPAVVRVRTVRIGAYP